MIKRRDIETGEIVPLSVYYLYYDGYDEIPECIIMDYYENKVEEIVEIIRGE